MLNNNVEKKSNDTEKNYDALYILQIATNICFICTLYVSLN